MIPKILHPQQMTIANWYAKYPQFADIFKMAAQNRLLDMLSPATTYDFMFNHLLKTHPSRVVAPPMLFNEEKDLRTIEKIKEGISYQAYVISLKYELLAQTMPSEIQDYYENYRIEREKTHHKEFTTGTITNSGNDTTFNNVHSTVTKNTSTGESESPRFAESSTTSTGNGNDNADNSMKTTYGKTITSEPGDEDSEENSLAHGYYNSGTKADMIREVRDIINYNIIDEWLKEIIPSFCCAYYDPAWSIPEEFL